MSIKTVRISGLIIFFIILFSKQYQILYYFPIMFISLEYLNRNIKYLSHYNYELLNTIFVGYVLFIAFDRGRPAPFYPLIEIIINSIEHILFGLVINIKISIYYTLFKNKPALVKKELLILAITFNIFGFLNEFFQNWYKHQSLWVLNLDSKKDILMNITGTLIFAFLYQKINKHIQNQSTVNPSDSVSS